ncbi:MAG TPA: glycosyltransferase family 39 protein, partial [Bacilli bacterium]
MIRRLAVFSILFTIFFISVFLSYSSSVSAITNLIENGSFEEIESDTPVMWSKSFYDQTADASKFTLESGQAKNGNQHVTIENLKPNDARWVQRIKVNPDTVYRLSGWMKAEGVDPNAAGANISVEGIAVTSVQFRDTQGEWQFVEMYGKTGPDQAQLAVTAGLGGYGSLSTGKASFDDIAVEESPEVPGGSEVVALDPGEAPSTSTETPAAADKKVSIWPMVLFSLLFAYLFSIVYRNMIREQRLVLSDPERVNTLLWVMLFAALILRLFIAPNVFGYASDVASFKAWAFDVSANGLANFYAEGKLADYPPGYMYVLYILGSLAKLFSIPFDSFLFTIIIKLPAMLADLVCSYLVYTVAKKYLHPLSALALAALYVFNPAIILNSAAWGQVDSFFMMFILLAMMFLVRGKLSLATALFALAVLIKPQALMFGPLLLFAFIGRRDLKTFAVSTLIGLLVIALVPLPFSIHQDKGPLWIIDLYTSTLSSYTFASLNAFNLIALTGGNWQPVTDKILFISYSMWSYILILLSLVYSAFMYFKNKQDDSKLYYIGFFFLTAVFMITAKMHERYLFYALLLGLMSFVHTRDRRVLFIFIGLSLTHFVNAYYVLINSF